MELRVYPSSMHYFISGHDGVDRIHERLRKDATSTVVLERVKVTQDDADAIVAAIKRDAAPDSSTGAFVGSVTGCRTVLPFSQPPCSCPPVSDSSIGVGTANALSFAMTTM